jgi:glycerophosphoryl diester phosphodiesterase
MLSISKSLVLTAIAVAAAGALAGPPAGSGTFLIAHRGASAYAPEHTLEAYRLALDQGADYVEPDVAVTKDGQLICSHDTFLERVTNVKEVFPDRGTEVTERGRTTKRWFVENFTLAEIKQLDAGSWFDPKFKGAKVATFQEAIDITRGKAGIFPEVKEPKRFHDKGFDPEGLIAAALKKNGLIGATVKGRPAVQMQVFDETSLRRLHEVLPDVPRSFLIGQADVAKKWLSAEGLKEAKTFVTGVAPSIQLIDRDPEIVTRAHAAGLTVVPYTFSLRPKTNPYPDAPPEWQKVIAEMMKTLPATPAEMTAAMRKYVEVYKVDGLFTDNPDLFPRAAVALAPVSGMQQQRASR